MDFESIGLNKNESKAFNALVKLGKSSAGDISRNSGVSDKKVYKILESLERKGLVRMIPEKTKMFVPEDPKALKKIIKK